MKFSSFKSQLSCSPVIVCAAVIRKEGRILLCTRPEGKHLAGMWEFPGGKLHDGETEFQCIRREIREELSVEVAVLDRIFRIIYNYPEKSIDIRFFRAFIFDEKSEIIPCEGQKVFWAAINEIHRMPVVPADSSFLNFLDL